MKHSDVIYYSRLVKHNYFMNWNFCRKLKDLTSKSNYIQVPTSYLCGLNLILALALTTIKVCKK